MAPQGTWDYYFALAPNVQAGSNGNKSIIFFTVNTSFVKRDSLWPEKPRGVQLQIKFP